VKLKYKLFVELKHRLGAVDQSLCCCVVINCDHSVKVVFIAGSVQ